MLGLNKKEDWKRIGRNDGKALQAGMQMPIRGFGLIEHVIEQEFSPIFSSKSAHYPTYPHCLSNTKKKENILPSILESQFMFNRFLLICEYVYLYTTASAHNTKSQSSQSRGF